MFRSACNWKFPGELGAMENDEQDKHLRKSSSRDRSRIFMLLVNVHSLSLLFSEPPCPRVIVYHHQRRVGRQQSRSGRDLWWQSTERDGVCGRTASPDIHHAYIRMKMWPC